MSQQRGSPWWTHFSFFHNKSSCLLELWSSSLASPICQEGQSERTFPIFPFFPDFTSFPAFSWFSPSISQFLAILLLSRGAICPLDPYWLRHCSGGCGIKLPSMQYCYEIILMRLVPCLSQAIVPIAVTLPWPWRVMTTWRDAHMTRYITR